MVLYGVILIKNNSEDDFYLCHIINAVSREHYQREVAKNAIFLIFE